MASKKQASAAAEPKKATAKKAEAKAEKKSFRAGELVQVADPVTGVHGSHIFRQTQDDGSIIVSPVDRPDFNLRVPKSSVSASAEK